MSKVGNFEVLGDLDSEICRARVKFPKNELLPLALMEEVGELANAILEFKGEKFDHAKIYVEALHVAAVAIRIASEGMTESNYDADTGYRTEGFYRDALIIAKSEGQSK